jgi:hypothetical protein
VADSTDIPQRDPSKSDDDDELNDDNEEEEDWEREGEKEEAERGRGGSDDGAEGPLSLEGGADTINDRDISLIATSVAPLSTPLYTFPKPPFPTRKEFQQIE